MKRALGMTLAFVLCWGFTTSLWAKTKEIQFRFVLTEEEAKTTKNNRYPYIHHRGDDSENIFVSKEVFLSTKDIDSIVIERKDESDPEHLPIFHVYFDEEGTKKLAEVTKTHTTKQLAIIVGDELFMTPYILHPISSGHFTLRTWKIDTNEKADQFVMDLGFAPSYK